MQLTCSMLNEHYQLIGARWRHWLALMLTLSSTVQCNTNETKVHSRLVLPGIGNTSVKAAHSIRSRLLELRIPKRDISQQKSKL